MNNNIDLSAYEGENTKNIDPNTIPHEVWHAEYIGLNYELSKETGEETHAYFCFCGFVKNFTKEQISHIEDPEYFGAICNSCPYHMENGKVFGDIKVINIDHEATKKYNMATFKCKCIHCGSKYLMTPPAIIKEGNKCTNPECTHGAGYDAYGYHFKNIEDRDFFLRVVNPSLVLRSESGKIIPFTFED